MERLSALHRPFSGPLCLDRHPPGAAHGPGPAGPDRGQPAAAIAQSPFSRAPSGALFDLKFSLYRSLNSSLSFLKQRAFVLSPLIIRLSFFLLLISTAVFCSSPLFIHASCI